MFDAVTTAESIPAWWIPVTGSGLPEVTCGSRWWLTSRLYSSTVTERTAAGVLHADETTRPTTVRWTVVECTFMPEPARPRPPSSRKKRASIDLRPGHAATIRLAGGMTVDMRVEYVEKPTVFAYTWRLPELPKDDPRRTFVESLEPHGDGTLLRVVETGFAQLPVETPRMTYESHSQDWTRELAELAEHLAGA